MKFFFHFIFSANLLYLNAQNGFTKKLFYDLPIDQSKEVIIEKVKTDTLTFRNFDVPPSGIQKLYAEARIKNKFIPLTSYKPRIEINDIKLYIDTVYSGVISDLSQEFIYKTFFKRRKAKKTFSILAQQLAADFLSYSDSEISSENFGFHYNLIKQRNFYLTNDKGSKCTLKLIDSKRSGQWQVIVTYNLY